MLTAKQIYDLGVKVGIDADLRGKKYVQEELRTNKATYQALSDKEKTYYDKEYFTNPYGDVRLLYAPSPDQKVKKVFAGIDAEEPELLLADRMGDIDMVISHHPNGIALADLPEVMKVQIEVMHLQGVPVHISENLMLSRIAEVNRGVHPINDHKAVDIARMLKISYMSAHTNADNLAAWFMTKEIARNQKKLVYVKDVMDMLMEIPEYQIAKQQKSGPAIWAGSGNRRAGRIAATEFTGGTNGSKDMFEQLSRAGVGTIIGMHMREDNRKEAEKYHINVVIAGHIASDSIGMNLFLDEIEKKGVEVVPIGGLIRVKRFKSKR